MLRDGGASATQLSARLDVPIGTMAYHMRQLRALGFVEVAARTPRRGAVEVRYALADAGLSTLLTLRRRLAPASPSEISRVRIGAAIRRLRESRALSEARLARDAGLTRGELRAIEAGVADPTVQTLIDVTACLGVTLRDVLA